MLSLMNHTRPTFDQFTWQAASVGQIEYCVCLLANDLLLTSYIVIGTTFSVILSSRIKLSLPHSQLPHGFGQWREE